MTGTFKAFKALIDQHAKLWTIDCDAWRVLCDINESEPIRNRPVLRVQIGSTILYRDENNQDVKEPRYFHSEKTIEVEYRRWADSGIGLFVRPNDTAGIAKRMEQCEAKIADKVAELNGIRAERKLIENACGMTAAEETVNLSGEAIKAIDALIINFIPEDIETARAMANWVVHAHENEIGYLFDDNGLLLALKSIAGIKEPPVDNSVDSGEN